eukprot:bmy_11043T0
MALCNRFSSALCGHAILCNNSGLDVVDTGPGSSVHVWYHTLNLLPLHLRLQTLHLKAQVPSVPIHQFPREDCRAQPAPGDRSAGPTAQDTELYDLENSVKKLNRQSLGVCSQVANTAKSNKAEQKTVHLKTLGVDFNLTSAKKKEKEEGEEEKKRRRGGRGRRRRRRRREEGQKEGRKERRGKEGRKEREGKGRDRKKGRKKERKREREKEKERKKGRKEERKKEKQF